MIRLALLVFIFPLFARAGVVVREIPIPPPAEVFSDWLDTYYGWGEHWIVRDRQAFLAFIHAQNIDDETYDLIRDSFHKEESTKKQSLLWYVQPNTTEIEGWFAVNQFIKSQLEPEVLHAIYVWLAERGTPVLALTKPDMKRYLDTLHLDEGVRFFADREVFAWHGQSYLPVTSRLWRGLEPQQKRHIAEELRPREQSFARGLSLSVQVPQDADLNALSLQVWPPDPATVLLALRDARAANSGDLLVPLEDLLPRFAFLFLNTYSEVDGPDCVNCAMNMYRGHGHRVGNEDVADYEFKLMDEFTRLRDGEITQPGDLLEWSDLNDRFVHVAVRVADGLVFTKNGITRVNPWQFQREREMLAVYFPKGDFKLRVYRPLSCAQFLAGR